MLSFILSVWHYTRKNKLKWVRVFIVLTVSLTGFIVLDGSTFWLVDSCLDASGSFNYEQDKCEY